MVRGMKRNPDAPQEPFYKRESTTVDTTQEAVKWIQEHAEEMLTWQKETKSG
jgi:hypothetical protein